MNFLKKIYLLSPLFLQTAIWPITRPALNIFTGLRVSGLDNLVDLKGGVIFASNHSSELDPIILPASLPFLSRLMPIFYVSRPKTFYENSSWRQFFYGGFFFKLWGAHSAISGYKDYGISLSSHINILQGGHSLLIFPEGKKTRNGDVMLDEARGGVVFLAEKTGLPVVPTKINGIFGMTFTDFILRRKNVSISFGKPIYAREIFEGAKTESRGQNPYKIASRFLLERIARL